MRYVKNNNYCFDSKLFDSNPSILCYLTFADSINSTPSTQFSNAQNLIKIKAFYECNRKKHLTASKICRRINTFYLVCLECTHTEQFPTWGRKMPFSMVCFSKFSGPLFLDQTIIFESTGEKVMKQAHNPGCYCSLRLLRLEIWQVCDCASQKSLSFGQKLH